MKTLEKNIYVGHNKGGTYQELVIHNDKMYEIFIHIETPLNQSKIFIKDVQENNKIIEKDIRGYDEKDFDMSNTSYFIKDNQKLKEQITKDFKNIINNLKELLKHIK